MAPLLGYWKIRGFVQPIKFMLAYTETEYEEKLYNYGTPPDTKTEWLKEKYSLGLAFPNLPYYIDGDLKITQSLAIMRYLARKLGLEPDTEEEKVRVDVAEQQTVDFRMGFVHICYNRDFENLRKEYLKTLPTQLKALSDFLGKRQWFAGDKLTYVDFLVYETMDHHRILAPGCLDEHTYLKDFMDRFEKLPAIEKYMKSENFMDWPVCADSAFFASRFHPKP